MFKKPPSWLLGSHFGFMPRNRKGFLRSWFFSPLCLGKGIVGGVANGELGLARDTEVKVPTGQEPEQEAPLAEPLGLTCLFSCREDQSGVRTLKGWGDAHSSSAFHHTGAWKRQLLGDRSRQREGHV